MRIRGKVTVNLRSLAHLTTKGEACGKGGESGKVVESGDGKELTEVPLKKQSDEHEPEQKYKIKSRDQAIYAIVDDNDAS